MMRQLFVVAQTTVRQYLRSPGLWALWALTIIYVGGEAVRSHLYLGVAYAIGSWQQIILPVGFALLTSPRPGDRSFVGATAVGVLDRSGDLGPFTGCPGESHFLPGCKPGIALARADGVTRYVHLEATKIGGTTGAVNVHKSLWSRPGSCVIWAWFDPETLELKEFLWLGEPGQPLPPLEELKIARPTKGNAQGYQAPRPPLRVVPKKWFKRVSSVEELLQELFGSRTSQLVQLRPDGRCRWRCGWCWGPARRWIGYGPYSEHEFRKACERLP